MAINQFTIIRNDLETDPVTLESEGLTIGRLIGNDLVLNHRAVSRTHAGIKAVNGAYWIFNLSQANGTLVNGDLVDGVPLADGDVIQLGPFLLRPAYTGDGLTLTVEMSVNPLPLAPARTGTLKLPGETGETVMLDRSLLPKSKPTKGRATQRLTSTGVHTGDLEEPAARALKVFWDNRKREAGKLEMPSPLRPQSQRRFGKARFYWRPTGDLRRAWPVAVLRW
ncbi:MAG: FHA domain-containing protein, partial [Acidobacteria bacterium]|nr:FHA domain-containing protein [Acidobacteriota bacterium]